jgi:peroxiredoxin
MNHLVRALLIWIAVVAANPAAAGSGELKPVKVAVTAGDFAATDLQGRATRFGALRGKVVLLNFWATWCPPCLKEMPAMERLHQAYKDRGLVVLGLSQDRASADTVRAFVDKLQVTFSIWHDRDGLVGRQYSIPGVPTSYLIGTDGRIAYRALGEHDWSGPEARAAVESLLRAAGRGQ